MRDVSVTIRAVSNGYVVTPGWPFEVTVHDSFEDAVATLARIMGVTEYGDELSVVIDRGVALPEPA